MGSAAIYVDDTDLVRQATLAMERGDAMAASAHLAEACRMNPANCTAWIWRATLTQDPAEIRRYLEEVVRAQPSHPTAVAWLEKLSGSPPAAAPAEETRACPFCSHRSKISVDRCPECRGVVKFNFDVVRSEPLPNALQMQFAIKHYEQFLADAEDAEVVERIALCRMNLGHWHGALEGLRRAVEMGSDSQDLFNTLAKLDRLPAVLIIAAAGERRAAVETAFDQAGYRAVAASSTREIKDAIERESPVAAVIDLTDSVPGGFDLCKTVRHHERGVKLPIVLAPGSGVVAAIRGRSAGADEVLGGLPEPDDLVAAAQRLVKSG